MERTMLPSLPWISGIALDSINIPTRIPAVVVISNLSVSQISYVGICGLMRFRRCPVLTSSSACCDVDLSRIVSTR